jgi:cytochrome bd ubiquinol oxidase subunit II
MSAFVSSIGMPEVVAGLMVLALNAYVLLGGGDFGGGVWDLVAGGSRRDAQRTLIADSIAPIWEANHVWLIVVVVMLFTGFPTAFGMLGTVLHIPISLLLIGIVLRGSAFVFRSYGSRDKARRETWGLAFAIASSVTPILLGVIIGAITTGDVAAAAGRIGSASFTDVFVSPWFSLFPFVVGLFALVLFAFLAAVYLTVVAKDTALQEDFRRRALIMAGAVFVVAGLALVLSFSAAPRIASGVMGTAWSLLLHLCTATSAVTAIVALWHRSYRVARVAAAAQVSFILWGWAFSQFPFIVPTTLTIRGAAAPRLTLELLLTGLAVGALVLIPSLRYLFKTFASSSSSSSG